MKTSYIPLDLCKSVVQLDRNTIANAITIICCIIYLEKSGKKVDTNLFRTFYVEQFLRKISGFGES